MARWSAAGNGRRSVGGAPRAEEWREVNLTPPFTIHSSLTRRCDASRPARQPAPPRAGVVQARPILVPPSPPQCRCASRLALHSAPHHNTPARTNRCDAACPSSVHSIASPPSPPQAASPPGRLAGHTGGLCRWRRAAVTWRRPSVLPYLLPSRNTRHKMLHYIFLYWTQLNFGPNLWMLFNIVPAALPAAPACPMLPPA